MVGMITAGGEGIGGARRDSAVVPVRRERNQRNGFRWRSCWRKMPMHYLDRRTKELRVARVARRVVARVVAHGEGDNADTTVTEVTSRQSPVPRWDTIVRAAARVVLRVVFARTR